MRSASFASLATPVPGNVFACMEELGLLRIRQREDEIEAECPMHEERLGKRDNHISFSVQAEEGYFNCFSCGYKGPFVRLVKDVLKVDWPEAVGWIRARGTIERVKRHLGWDQVDGTLKTGPIDTSQVYNEAHLALFTDPPEWALDKRNIELWAAQEYGVVWDPKNDAWITPIRDEEGVLLGWQEKNERYFRNKPRDVRKADHIFGLDTFQGGRALVVESPLDCPRILTAGVAGALSVYGSAVSDRQFALILEHADEVIWGLDGDKAGDQQHESLRMRCMRRGFPSKFLSYDHVGEEVTDPGEMSDEEILIAVDNAYSGVVARFK
jgi:hypothetical protein